MTNFPGQFRTNLHPIKLACVEGESLIHIVHVMSNVTSMTVM